MSAKYPNLELLEYKIGEYVGDVYESSYLVYCRADMFLQSWPNTAGGFSRPGMLSGQAITDEYTTVFMVRDQFNNIFYAVCFGDHFGYYIREPNDQFFEDLKNRRMCRVYEADDRYKTCFIPEG